MLTRSQMKRAEAYRRTYGRRGERRPLPLATKPVDGARSARPEVVQIRHPETGELVWTRREWDTE